jgi:hypothetical protein
LTQSGYKSALDITVVGTTIVAVGGQMRTGQAVAFTKIAREKFVYVMNQ